MTLHVIVYVIVHIVSYHIISYHIISYHIISYHIISYHIISYHIISYRVISCHIVSYRVISCHIVSYRVISCHIMSYRVISYIMSCHIISYHMIVYIIFWSRCAGAVAEFVRKRRSLDRKPISKSQKSAIQLCACSIQCTAAFGSSGSRELPQICLIPIISEIFSTSHVILFLVK